MVLHQKRDEILPDSQFFPGELQYLVPGNRGRCLDGRRTPGFVEDIFLDSALFRWRITDFEDEGSFWDIPVENVNRFQFALDSEKLSEEEVHKLQGIMEALDFDTIIEPTREKEAKTRSKIEESVLMAYDWLRRHSLFVQGNSHLDLRDLAAIPMVLCEDFDKYMTEMNLSEIERVTAEQMVLNPNSGEWVKGINIVLAEMGLTRYAGKVPRTRDIFLGLGTKEIRKAYIMHRLGFMQAFYRIYDLTEVALFRGMASESDWCAKPRSLLSSTFSHAVAQSFASENQSPKYRSSYVVKFTVPVSALFMTFLETKAMNGRYQEQEALILCKESFCI